PIRAADSVGGSSSVRFIIRTLAAAVALWVAVQLLDGIEVTAPENSATYWGTLLIVALIFGLINAIVKPIVKALGCALIVLTLGLFLLVINAALPLLTSWVAGPLSIDFPVASFRVDAFLGAITISLVRSVTALFVLTLGLFLLVINAAMLLLTSWVAGHLSIDFHVASFWPDAFLGAIIISVVSWVLGLFIPDGD